MIDYHSDDEARLRREMRGFSVIDPAIRKQLSRQYHQWYYEREHGAERKVRPELKCNTCKEYFPREITTQVKSGTRRQWVVYCPVCLNKRKPRLSK